MRRRKGLIFALLLIAVPILNPAVGPARAQGGEPAITYRMLGQGSLSLYLYRFRFQPAASIPGPYPETMLVSVVNGTFLLYLGQGARVYLDPRATGSGQVETLEPVGTSGTETTFEDVAANNGPTFACAPTCQVRMGSGGLEVVGGATVGNVAIKLKAGAAVAFAGPTSGFVCNTGDSPGRIEVAVAGLTDPQQFSWLAHATQQSSADAGAAPGSFRMSSLPARNPGGCQGKTG
jgi:hypothetical protein